MTAHQLEQRVRVLETLRQDAPALIRRGRLLPGPPARRARVLAHHHVPHLPGRNPDHPLQPQQLAQPPDVPLAVLAVRARLPRVRGQQADLLVVADRPHRRPRRLGQRADPHQSPLGRISDTKAPTSDVAARIHSASCMLATKGSSVASSRPVVTPEKILNSVSLSTEEVTTASTKAIEIPAPVFWSMFRAPAAIPRRWAGPVPIIAAVLGELNMPEPTPTMNSHTADQTYGVCTPSVVIPASATAPTTIPHAASAREPRLSAHIPASGEAISIPIAIGASSMPALIGSSPLTP